MFRVTLASMSGTMLEFYDHFVYGSAAAVVFPAVFFVSMPPTVALLLSLVTYSVAFIARPLGALVFGYFGDKVGRKNVLIVALLIMGGATFLIGCLPDYATAGSFGAVALCILRLLQGVALGGEWGGAALMVNEYTTSPRLKSILGSIVQVASPLGFLLASGTLSLISDLGGEAFLLGGGWRIPFLASAVLVVIGFYMRFGIEESPEFLERKEESRPAPLMDVVKNHGREVLLAIGTRIGSDTAFYVFAMFPLVYLPRIGITSGSALLVGVFASLGQMVGTPIFGWLCGRWGTRKVLIVGAVVNMLYAFAYIFLLDTQNPTIILAGAFVSLFCLAMLWAPLASHLPAMFPVHVRYTATSIGFQMAGVFGGALAPTICLMLLENTGTAMSVPVYLGATLLLALLCTIKTKVPAPSRETES
ncbi:transporter, major facilitator family protein [Slackia exigua ATCC 700122]|uniref:Transporter, major facilitator family protein n=2 Tax=Slackia TaxID=84108 RepID=D0WIX0_SLAES|nr:transporter, major facilitator family protein [Slackia exigua ATCC 700122]